MFCRHVFGNISGRFRGVSRFWGNFAGPRPHEISEALIGQQSASSSPIYTTEKNWVWTHKKVSVDWIFLPCKPSVPCFHEMDPDSLFSVCFFNQPLVQVACTDVLVKTFFWWRLVKLTLILSLIVKTCPELVFERQTIRSIFLFTETTKHWPLCHIIILILPQPS